MEDNIFIFLNNIFVGFFSIFINVQILVIAFMQIPTDNKNIIYLVLDYPKYIE